MIYYNRVMKMASRYKFSEEEIKKIDANCKCKLDTCTCNLREYLFEAAV